MKALLLVVTLLPLVAMAYSTLDFGNLYKESGVIVEGHLSGEEIEKVKIIRKSTLPDVEFHEDTYILTNLIVEGRVKYQKMDFEQFSHHVETEMNSEGKVIIKCRVLIPERFYSKAYRAETIENSNAWFIVYSPLTNTLYAYEELAISQTKLFIPDYMTGSVGEPLKSMPSNQSQEATP